MSMKPAKRVKIAWVPKRLRLAVFPERKQWIAADLRGYRVAQGESPLDAIRTLLWTCGAANALAAEQRAKGRRVIRWRLLHGAWRASARQHIRQMEALAKKSGCILDGVVVPRVRLVKWKARGA